MKIPFILWINILNFKKIKFIYIYDLNWYLKVWHIN